MIDVFHDQSYFRNLIFHSLDLAYLVFRKNISHITFKYGLPIRTLICIDLIQKNFQLFQIHVLDIKICILVIIKRIINFQGSNLICIIGVMQQVGIKVIGMMSGTSLDGVDLALCQFHRQINKKQGQSKWRYRLIAAKTYSYPKYIIDILDDMTKKQTTYLDFYQKQLNYSKFLVQVVCLFIQQFHISKYELFSMHGHTIFHQPKQNLTLQAGNITYIASQLKVSVVGNFRQLDVYRGGQGAPLAPFGQEIFAGEAFLNLGGIANISYKKKGFDIGFCNLFFNYFLKKNYNLEYDSQGSKGREGQINNEIMQFFQKNNVFKLGHSLARQQFQVFLQKITNNLSTYKVTDILTTYYHFLAEQIAKTTSDLIIDQKITVMCSGGGAKNQFLVQLLNSKSKLQFIIPNDDIINFKEAIIFALLGVKFLYGQKNCNLGIGGNLIKGQFLTSGNNNITNH